MIRIMPGLVISLRPEPFDEGVLRPALNGQCSLFDALHYLISFDERLFRFSDRFVCLLDAALEYGRLLPFPRAVIL
jgi:hypothetical protein